MFQFGVLFFIQWLF